MIVFDLSCSDGHRFEAWFRSTSDFVGQQDSGLLICPHCGSEHITKAPMAPAVPMKGNMASCRKSVEIIDQVEAKQLSNAPVPARIAKAMKALAKAQTDALKNSTWVGKSFTDQSRAMHYGERDQSVIHGEATPQQARDLLDEGISVAPLPFPVAPPDDLN